MKKIAFLLYDARSGSTVLSAYLNRHKGISVSQESGFVHIILEHAGTQIAADQLSGLLDRLYSEKQFCEMNIDREAIERRLRQIGSPLEKKQIIDEILDIYFSDRDPSADILLLKCPRIIFHLGAMIDLYEDVRFIHLVRDGRAVFSSKRRSRSIKGSAMERNLLKAATDWSRRQRVARRYPDHVTVLRYEDFLADPARQIDGLLDFLGVEGPGREETKLVADYSESIGGSQRHLHSNVGQSLDVSRVDRWTSHLSEAEVLAYEWFNGSELVRYGYQPVYSSGNVSLGLRLAAAWVVFSNVFHYIVTRTRNLFYLSFVRRTLWQRLVAKSYEYK